MILKVIQNEGNYFLGNILGDILEGDFPHTSHF